MGEVWVARNEATSADVALKILRRDADKNMQAEARFRHEARLSAMLSHRSIVRIFDLLEEPDGDLVLVMELLRGETLHAFLERMGPRTSKEAVAILSPILSALSHAHDLGIVHRDVTPANIYLAVDPDGQVTPKLVDFGIAKVASGDRISAEAREFHLDARGVPSTGVHTIDGSVLGTPRYMSPEQVRMQADIDARSDLFSVGVVLYEILAGASPFAAATPLKSLAAVLDAHVDPDPRIAPQVWVELQRALAKHRYERHGTAQELATALRAAVGESEGSLAAALRRTHPPPRWGDDSAVLPAPLPAPFHTTSIEGQSLAFRAPRNRGSWAAWALLGIFAGVAIALAVLALRSPPDNTMRTPPNAASSPGPTATLATAVTTAAMAASATTTTTSATASASALSAKVSLPAPPQSPQLPRAGAKPPSTAAPSKAKPVATTPGF